MNTNIKALVIEDTPDHAELIRLEMQSIPGCAVVMVACMQDALAALKDQSFDIILSDLNLPDSDRNQTVRKLKETAPQTPLLVLTCDEVDTNGFDSIMMGAQEYLRKDELATSRIDRVLMHAIKRQRILNENMELAEELHKQNMALEIERGKAEAAMRAKAEFLTNMSHEIRTPLTSILGFIDVAIDTIGEDLNADTDRALNIVKQNSTHLLSLINNILDAAKVDAGAVDIELIPSRIGDILESCVELISPMAHEKGLRIQYSLCGETPSLLLLDPTRLKQIIVNLLGNAVKFTDQGTITLEVTSTQVGPENHWVSIAVRDTGIGIRGAELTKIREFGSFSQANASTTRRFGGSGLGLRISQGLAKIMGGSIEVESDFGSGSTFTLSLKASSITSDQMNTQTKCLNKAGMQDLTGLRVLIVDDSPDNCRLFGYYLKKYNAIVESVVDGEQAVQRVLSSDKPHIDLVLMDLQMPVLDGHHAFQRIREAGINTPIYATSASTGIEDRALVTNAGFSGFLPKPIDPNELHHIAVGVHRDLKRPSSAA
jgi:signal transduction histidine kinase